MKNPKKWVSCSVLSAGLSLGVSLLANAQTPPQQVETIVVRPSKVDGPSGLTLGDLLPDAPFDFGVFDKMGLLDWLFPRIDWDEEILKAKKFCMTASDSCSTWEIRAAGVCIPAKGTRDISSGCGIAVSRDGVSGGGDCRQVSIKNRC